MRRDVNPSGGFAVVTFRGNGGQQYPRMLRIDFVQRLGDAHTAVGSALDSGVMKYFAGGIRRLFILFCLRITDVALHARICGKKAVVDAKILTDRFV